MAKTATNLQGTPGIFDWVGRHRHLLVPVSFLLLLIVLVVPLPPAMMDVLLSANISLAAVILVSTIYMNKPLDFSVFPALLLATTLVFVADHIWLFLIAWELMALAAYCLVSFEHEQPETRKAGVLYFIMSHIDAGCIILGFLLLFQASGDYSFDSGLTHTLALLTGATRPDAIVCGNDAMALGAISAARRLKLRVPEDVAVAGFDDIPAANWEPYSLTTVQNPVEKTTEEALRLLRLRMEGDTRPFEVVRLTPKLARRLSA